MVCLLVGLVVLYWLFASCLFIDKICLIIIDLIVLLLIVLRIFVF